MIGIQIANFIIVLKKASFWEAFFVILTGIRAFYNLMNELKVFKFGLYL